MVQILTAADAIAAVDDPSEVNIVCFSPSRDLVQQTAAAFRAQLGDDVDILAVSSGNPLDLRPSVPVKRPTVILKGSKIP